MFHRWINRSIEYLRIFFSLDADIAPVSHDYIDHRIRVLEDRIAWLEKRHTDEMLDIALSDGSG